MPGTPQDPPVVIHLLVLRAIVVVLQVYWAVMHRLLLGQRNHVVSEEFKDQISKSGMYVDGRCEISKIKIKKNT